MVARDPRDRLVVGLDPGDGLDVARRAHVDDREPRPGDGPGDLGRLDPGDDAVPLPLREPPGRRVAAAEFGEVDRPRFVLPDVGHDPGEQPAGVGVRGLDQEGDGAALSHGDRLVRILIASF